MSYCVVPRELASEWFESLNSHYGADPEMTVIVDRRHSERRHGAPSAQAAEQRVLRDRRRRRIAGELPALYGETRAPGAE